MAAMPTRITLPPCDILLVAILARVSGTAYPRSLWRRRSLLIGAVPNMIAASWLQGDEGVERKKASDFPQELLNLFDHQAPGRMDRRDFLGGAQKFATAGVTAAMLLDMLRPNYAWAIQVPPEDKRIKAGYETVPSPNGNGSIKGYLVRPANAEKLPAVLVIHEN